MGREQAEDLIKAYKARLSGFIDRRPSGTRQRLADALGKHRSFITQITSTLYSTPLPARHLPTIFAVCHFSTEEKRQFLADYHAAHPERKTGTEKAKGLRHISLMVLDLGDERKNRLFDEAVADFTHRMGALLVEEDD